MTANREFFTYRKTGLIKFAQKSWDEKTFSKLVTVRITLPNIYIYKTIQL